MTVPSLSISEFSAIQLERTLLTRERSGLEKEDLKFIPNL